jgi:hypothetical protein
VYFVSFVVKGFIFARRQNNPKPKQHFTSLCQKMAGNDQDCEIPEPDFENALAASLPANRFCYRIRAACHHFSTGAAHVTPNQTPNDC